jgi:hypothetical protein
LPSSRLRRSAISAIFAFEDRGALRQDLAARPAPAWTPSRERLLRRLDGRVDVRRVGVLQQPDHVARVGRVDVLERASGAGRAPFTVDEVEVCGWATVAVGIR